MSWIYLIVAGLFEVAFTSCMGKVKETTGSEMYWWFTGFIISMSISMFLLIKAINRVQEAIDAGEKVVPTVKKCPFCCTDIPVKAVRCPHCTSELSEK